MSMRKDMKIKQNQTSEQKGKPAGEVEVRPALVYENLHICGGIQSMCSCRHIHNSLPDSVALLHWEK